MTKFFSRLFLAAVLSAAFAAPAAAQTGKRAKKTTSANKRDGNPAATARAKKKARSFNFEADEIDGDRINPDGTTVFGIRDRKKPSLIRYRAHFLPEILETAENL